MEYTHLELDDLFADNTSGSSVLLDNLQQKMHDYLQNNGIHLTEFFEKVKIIQHRWSHFLVVQHFIAGLLSLSDIRSPEEIKTWITDYKKRWSNQGEKWANHLLPLISRFTEPLLTHSNSGSIKSTIEALGEKGYRPQVFQTLSGPVNEGLIQGNALAELGLNTTVIADAMTPYGVKESSVVLLGADAVYPSGFLNKIGSLNICMAAQLSEVPVYVIIDSRKVSEGFPDDEELKPSNEVIPAERENLQAMNFYFELVPHRYVTRYVTEEGLKKPGEVFN